jgi:deoxyribose-phosphate aldolase
MKSSSLTDSRLLEPRDLASMIEHTILGADISESDVIAHINEALELDVLGVCLPLAWVPLAKQLLAESNKKVITVIDFPLGQKSSKAKADEADAAKQLGADEIDMVLDYQALINKEYQKALSDLQAVVERIAPLPVKVIVETSALNHEQLAIACALVALSGAAFIKTSTGFHKAGARAEDIALMRALLPARVLIKASGGIKDFVSAQAMIKAGATRIGSSKSKNILQG